MLTLRIIVIIICALFVLFVCTQVATRKLLLKYSLIWLTLALLVLLGALFPDVVSSLATLLGFDVTSNFIFFVGLFFLLAICLSLSVVVSRQSIRIKNLVQDLALLNSKTTSNREVSQDNSKQV